MNDLSFALDSVYNNKLVIFKLVTYLAHCYANAITSIDTNMIMLDTLVNVHMIVYYLDWFNMFGVNTKCISM